MHFDGISVELHRIIQDRIADLPAGHIYVCLEDKYAKRCAGKDQVYDPTGNFQRMFRSLQRQAQIAPQRRYHELRAAFATAMIDHHGLSRAADALGHASTQTTRKYDRKSQMSLVAEIGLVARKCYASNVS
jgi:integrase